jgi:tRNA threonylcarbamoyladenosine biosynthesis protein TsaB
VSVSAEPRVLIIETSSRAGQVAIARGETLLAARRLEEARRHARDLAPAVAELLVTQGWKARDLNAVFVSRGPGSYTGLRVGIMSAKTLAYATGCALIGIDTFAAIAQQAPAESSRLDVLADAQQGKVYVQPFARSADNTWLALAALTVQPLDEWLARREAEAWVSGPGLHVCSQQLPDHVPLAPETGWDPRAESLLRLGIARYRAGERDDAWTLEPLYLRPSAAEEQWKRRKA